MYSMDELVRRAAAAAVAVAGFSNEIDAAGFRFNRRYWRNPD